MLPGGHRLRCQDSHLLALGQQALRLHPGLQGETRQAGGQRHHQLRAEGHSSGPAVRVLVPQQQHDQLPARGECGDCGAGPGQRLPVGGPAQHHRGQADHQPDQAGGRWELHLRSREHGPGYSPTLHIKR